MVAYLSRCRSNSTNLNTGPVIVSDWVVNYPADAGRDHPAHLATAKSGMGYALPEEYSLVTVRQAKTESMGWTE